MVPEFVDAVVGAGAHSGAEAKASTKPTDESGSEHEDSSEVEVLARKLAEKISRQTDSAETEIGEVAEGQKRQTYDKADRGDDESKFQGGDAEQPAVTGTTLPALIQPRPRFLVIGWAAWGVFVAGFLLALFFFREPMVKAWPPATRLYELVGMEESTSNLLPSKFRSHRDALKIRNQAEPRANPDGSFDLIISGSIENTTSQTIRLPSIKGVLRNADKQTIHQWRVDLSQSLIAPQGRLEFRTEVRSVPPETTEYEIAPEWQR
jgi:hypothetical protein